MKKQNQLATIAPKTPALCAVPKVTKTEAIKAAVERARIKHDEQQTAHLAKVKDFDERVKAAALQHLTREAAQGVLTDPAVRIVGDWGDNLGNVQMIFLLPVGSFGALLRENKKLDKENPGCFDSDRVEKRLKAKLDTTAERINLILKDEQNVRTIDALLASLG